MFAIINNTNGRMRAKEMKGSDEPELGHGEWVCDLAADWSEAKRKLSEARSLTYPDSL